MNPQEHATLSEKELLTFVSSPIPAPVQARYSKLIAQRQAEALTPDEHRELIDLTEQIEQIEQIDAQRAEYLTALARIRHVPVSQLMTDLGINDPVQHG